MSIWYEIRWLVADLTVALAIKIAPNGKPKDYLIDYYTKFLRTQIAMLKRDLDRQES